LRKRLAAPETTKPALGGLRQRLVIAAVSWLRGQDFGL